MPTSKFVSIRQFIHQLPYTPVLGGGLTDSEDIILLKYSLPPSEVKVPELEENLLFVSLFPKIQYENLNHQRSKALFLHQGDVAVTPAGYPQHWRWLSQFDGVNLFIPSSLIREIGKDLVKGDIDSVSLIQSNVRSIPLLSALALELLSDLEAGSPCGKTYADTLTRSIVMYLLAHHSTAKIVGSSAILRTDDTYVARAIDFITAHLGEDLHLSAIASACDVSVNRLCEVFKQSVGQSVHQFVIEQRIERAKYLLKKSKMPLVEISQEIGFSNQAHFTTTFRKTCGITSNQYRHDFV